MALVILLLASRPAFAVIADVNGTITYLQTPPTDTDVADWSTGWPAAGVTGWDYVGKNGGTCAVYIGNGWVLTAAHVGPGPLDLNGVVYNPVADSEKSFDETEGKADLVMYRVSPVPALAPLTISTESPSLGDSVVMIGYGGDHGKTWAQSTVSRVDAGVRTGPTRTIDFFTAITDNNKSALTGGDSGGGAFIRDPVTGQWQLAGINHARSHDTDSCFVQLSRYAPQIEEIRSGYPRHFAQYTMLGGIIFLFLVLVWQIARSLRRRPRWD